MIIRAQKLEKYMHGRSRSFFAGLFLEGKFVSNKKGNIRSVIVPVMVPFVWKSYRHKSGPILYQQLLQ